MTYTKTAWTVKAGKHSQFYLFCLFQTEKGNVLYQWNQRLKISGFSCMKLPTKIVYKPVNNGPAFTKFCSFVDEYVCYKNIL